MRYITATELKTNLGKYLELSKEEDIYVTKNNVVITVLTNPQTKAFLDLVAFRDGLNVDPDFDPNKALEEEIMSKCGF